MKDHYKKENLGKIVKESFSLAEVLRKIGIKDMGSNFATLKKYIQLYGLDTSHFRGRTWNKGMQHTDYAALNKLEDVLKLNTYIKGCCLKNRLIKEGLKESKCERCGNNGVWMNAKLTLELHHINGDHYDNRIENLQILCPNCHSQTKNYRNKNVSRKEIIKPIKHGGYICECHYCHKQFDSIKKNSHFCCREHYNAFLRKSRK